MASGSSVGWIFVNLVGSVCVNLGQNVMKLGHNKWAALELPEEERPNIKCIRQWQIGVVVFIGGGVATFLSFGYAPQSLLSALGSVQFVSNVVFASLVLKEKVTMRVIAATCGIVAGCILLVIFSSKESKLLTVPELMSYYKSPAYIAYIVCSVFVAASFYATYRYGKRVTRNPPYPQYWDRLLPVAYMMYASPLGTQAILFSKSVSTLLRATLSGDSQLGYWFTYVILIAFILTIIFWATRLDKSLKLFPAIVIVPTMQIGWTIFSILSGGIYFQEFQTYSALQLGMFVLGVAIIMVGVFFLTPSAEAKYTEMGEEEMSERDAAVMRSNQLAEPLSPDLRTDSDEGLPQHVASVRDLVAAWADSPRASPQIGLTRLSVDGHPGAPPLRRLGPSGVLRASESGGAHIQADAVIEEQEQEHRSFVEQLHAVRDALREDFDLDIMKAFQRLRHMGTDRSVTLSPVTGMPIGTCPGWYTEDVAGPSSGSEAAPDGVCCAAHPDGAPRQQRLTRSISGPVVHDPAAPASNSVPAMAAPRLSASYSVTAVASGTPDGKGTPGPDKVLAAEGKGRTGEADTDAIVVDIIEPGSPPALRVKPPPPTEAPEERRTGPGGLQQRLPSPGPSDSPASSPATGGAGTPVAPLGSASKLRPSRPPPPRPLPAPPPPPESGQGEPAGTGGAAVQGADEAPSPPHSTLEASLTPLTESSRRPSGSEKWQLPGRRKSLRNRERSELDEPLRATSKYASSFSHTSAGTDPFGGEPSHSSDDGSGSDGEGAHEEEEEEEEE